MEYEVSDLWSTIEKGTMRGISQQHTKLILYNLLCALKYIHSANVMHRDLKASNILINQECQIKICDFGIARTLPETHIGKGSGHSRRIRDSIYKKDLKTERDPEKLKKMIAKKVLK